MTQKQRLSYLIQYFSEERGIPCPTIDPRNLRGLVNQRPPNPLPTEVLEVEEAYLQENLGQITALSDLSPVKPQIYLWQGDITKLEVDAIVNAANSALLGCFYPCHGCIDNAIHTNAGIRLRLACEELMEKQGHPEPTGAAKITPAFQLPSKFVIHTVGPIVGDTLTSELREDLCRCYRSCLEIASENALESIAFCCISTGEFRFPQKEACDIAVDTVETYLKETNSPLNVVFNVFKEEDLRLYEEKFT